MDAERRIAELEAALAAKDAALAARDARIAELEAQVAKLTAQVGLLAEQLGRSSRNSNKPPSSDPPSSRAERRARMKQDKKRNRGAQPGHSGSKRALLPPDQVDETVNHFPEQCENCWLALPKTPDPRAERSQTTELPPVKPHTTEHRRHAVVCAHCRHKTWAPYEIIPAFGLRLESIVSLLTGVFNLSRRATATLLHDLLGVRLSLGAVSAIEARVSEAVKSPVDEAWQSVTRAEVKHTDGTSWFQTGVMCSLWTIASTSATVFKILANGQKATLKSMFAEMFGFLVSDRATALTFWAMEMRQICWAHLLRKFISFSEATGPAASIGGELLDYVGIMFVYWDELKVGTLSRTAFRAQMAPVRTQVEAALERAVAAKIPGLSGSCADILEHKAALWTFVEHDGVEPTNNHAERELRAFVLWRKRSFGTQSERGNLFAERLMTVAHTARKQKKNVLAFLTECRTAARDGEAAPSLFARATVAT